MQKRILSISLTALLFSLFIFSCSKLDTTDIGSDVLPAVDNVNTFETILTINTTQGVFNTDTTKVSNTDDHVFGKINNDPLFGTTTANIFAQFKPTFYPYYYGNAGDTINPALDSRTGFDSVVLCFSYKGNWGDSLIPLQFQVREIPFSTGGIWDSLYQVKDINYVPATSGIVIGSTTVDIASLGNYVKYINRKDSVKNQIRIKLSGAFASQLFARDTNVLGNNSFRTDSAFKLFNKGFAVTANGSGNSLLYTNFADSSTKLEIHYRRKNGGAIDTTFSVFKVLTAATSLTPSSTANNIIRNRSGFPVSSPAADEIYLQTSPGTYANLSIPDLTTLSNRIIHRAEIIVEQIPSNAILDGYFSAPTYLYIDLKDTGAITAPDKWKPIYFDLNPSQSYNPDLTFGSFFPTGGIDFFSFGGYLRNKTDNLTSNQINYYNFNITRYVQQIVTKHTTNYSLRLYAPYNIIYPQYSLTNIPFANRLAKGRLKVGSGTNANYKMRLRLVYSKI